MGITIKTIAADYAKDALADARRDSDIDDTEASVLETARQYLWERIDSCEHVIYNQSAWEIVADDPDYCESAADVMGLSIDYDYQRNGITSVIQTLAFAGLYCEADAWLTEISA